MALGEEVVVKKVMTARVPGGGGEADAAAQRPGRGLSVQFAPMTGAQQIRDSWPSEPC